MQHAKKTRPISAGGKKRGESRGIPFAVQKLGLPHVHLLVWTDESRAERDARIDSVVAAGASCESDIVFSLQLDKMLHSCREASKDNANTVDPLPFDPRPSPY